MKEIDQVKLLKTLSTREQVENMRVGMIREILGLRQEVKQELETYKQSNSKIVDYFAANNSHFGVILIISIILIIALGCGVYYITEILTKLTKLGL
jgi:hypothetical protein